ncbi:transposase [Pseudonocardia alni]|uniref:transposase n=1 Tax=Pseudonocardia alni TaxID=33907 RepID=UPI0036253513
MIRRLAEQLGVHHEALRNWIRQARPATANVTTARPPPSPRNCANWARRTPNCAGPPTPTC